VVTSSILDASTISSAKSVRFAPLARPRCCHQDIAPKLRIVWSIASLHLGLSVLLSQLLQKPLLQLPLSSARDQDSTRYLATKQPRIQIPSLLLPPLWASRRSTKSCYISCWFRVSPPDHGSFTSLLTIRTRILALELFSEPCTISNLLGTGVFQSKMDHEILI